MSSVTFPPTLAPGTPIRSDEFYFESVFIQVENEIFRVPRYRLEMESEIFQQWFPRPFEESVHAHGTNENQPLHFGGDSAAKFELFLSVLYPLVRKDPLARPVSDWEAILTFATEWKLDQVRAEVLEILGNATEGPILSMRIRLGRTFEIRAWIKNGYSNLVQRDAPLDEQEMKNLGFAGTARVCRFRELQCKDQWDDISTSRLEWATNMELSERAQEQVNRTEHEKPRAALPINIVDEVNAKCPKKPVQRNHLYFLEDIILQAENILYRLPRARFQHGSGVFQDLLALPQGQNVPEGLSDEHPIVLHGVDSNAFNQFLRILFPCSEILPTLDLKAWSSIAYLANMWSFEDVMVLAVREMTPLLKPDDMIVEQIVLGRQYHVKEWLLQGCWRLASRKTPPSKQERLRIGLEALVVVSELREMAFVDAPKPNCQRGYHHSPNSRCGNCTNCTQKRYEHKPPSLQDAEKALGDILDGMVR